MIFNSLSNKSPDCIWCIGSYVLPGGSHATDGLVCCIPRKNYLIGGSCVYCQHTAHLPGVHPERSEGIDGTITGVKISYDQFSLVNVLIADHCNHTAGGGIKHFPNQWFD